MNLLYSRRLFDRSSFVFRRGTAHLACFLCVVAVSHASAQIAQTSSHTTPLTAKSAIAAKPTLKTPANSMVACFDDAALQTTLAASQNQAQLLYVWSPRMPYSAEYASDAAAMAKAMGLNFIALLDPSVGEAELAQSLATLQQQYPASGRVLQTSARLCSEQLKARDASLHFPSAFVLQGGGWMGTPIRGAMPPAHWRDAMALRLSAGLTTDTQATSKLAKSKLPTASASGSAPMKPVTPDVASASRPAPETSKPAAALAPPNCVAANEFIPLSDALAGSDVDAYGNSRVVLGSYERVSPDGRFILRSYSGAKIGKVSLIELSAPPTRIVKIHATPLSNEAFPVQGSWRYIVDINGEHYVLADLLQQGAKAKPRFRAGMTGFYAAAAELPESQNGGVQIRSLSWPKATGSGDNQGVGTLNMRSIRVDSKSHRLLSESPIYPLCRARVAEDGTQYALPMISVDGKEFSALPQAAADGEQRMHIYAFGETGADAGHGCQLQDRFDFAAGKSIFGFPQQGRPADVVFEYDKQIWWYARQSKQLHNLAPYTDEKSAIREVMAQAFPGLTEDGRVIYAASWKRCENADIKPNANTSADSNANPSTNFSTNSSANPSANPSAKPKTSSCQAEVGYIIADPYQSNAYVQATPKDTAQSCISQSRVEALRQRFANKLAE